MITVIISILLSLNLISTPAEYEQMAIEEKTQMAIIVEELSL